MGFCGKLKQAEQGKLKQWYGNGLLWKIETGRAGEVKTMVWKWAVAES